MTTTFLNTKIREFGEKILDTTRIVTTTVINTNVGEADTKIPDHAKYITTQEFNNLNTENFAARLKQDNLESKTNFNNKLIKVNRKNISNKRKYLELQKNLNSLTTGRVFTVEFILQVMVDLKARLFINQDLIR